MPWSPSSIPREENKLRKKIEAMGTEGIRVIAGLAAEHESLHGRYHGVVLSPGIDPAVPLVQNFIKRRIDMIGELELAYRIMCQCARSSASLPGTNGQNGTTTQLVEKMLNACGVKCTCPHLRQHRATKLSRPKVRESKHLDVMTVEVSSFQLETIRRFRCDTAVWLGFAADHLDRYHSMAEYYAAKIRIFENQTADDWAVINYRDKLPELTARKITFSGYLSGADFEMRSGVIYFRGERALAMAETNLRGSHNAENLMAALGVGVTRGLSLAQMTPPLCEYRPLPPPVRNSPHGQRSRMEVNDSKGTNPDSVEKALHSETRRVVLIAGGKDKGFEYDLLTDLVVARCRAAVVLGEMADRIETMWKSRLPVANAGWSLEKAVELAHGLAQPGDVVLFSPGTSSFDMFKNYADRGNQFRALVQALPS